MRNILMLLLLLSAFICPAFAEDGVKAPISVFRITAQDVLDITIQDHSDLSRMVTVMPDGTISYPYMGEFRVANLTLHELTDRVSKALGKQISNPMVTVTLRTLHTSDIRQVSILGAIKNPGKRQLKDGWRVLDLLADSGGLTVDRPDHVVATLIRGSTETIPVDISRIMSVADKNANVTLDADDVLLVHEIERTFTEVQLLGEVGKPGGYPLPPDGSITTVIALAGGVGPRAALSKATITHGSTSIPVDLRALRIDGRVPNDIRLAPGDTLFIPQNRLFYALFGAVTRPGIQDFPEDKPITVIAALAQGGGQTPDANLKVVSVVHPTKDGKTSVTTVNMENMLKKGDLARDIELQPGDILYVPSKSQKRTGPGLSDILSFLPFMGVLHL